MIKRNKIVALVRLFVCVNYFSCSQIDLSPQQSTSSPSNIVVSIAVPSSTDSPDHKLNEQIISIVETVEQNENYIDLRSINNQSHLSLPAGIIRDVGSVRYLIAIDSLKFTSNAALLSAYAAIEFPGTTEKLAFRGSHIKFNPAGVAGSDYSRLYLASTHVIKINSHVRLRLKGNGQNWIEWDCNGFKAINLMGNFEFYNGKILPDPADNPKKDTVVTATFQMYTQNLHEFISSVSITPFIISGLPDWSFKVTNAVVDMSELSNMPSFSFPPDYPIENLATPQSWMGFSLQSLKVKLPKQLSKTGKRTEINISNMQIDHMGLSGIFQVNDLFNCSEGSMSGWAYSIEDLGVGFLTNRINNGHLAGKINIPIIDSSQTLNYSAHIHYNYSEKETDFNFSIKPAENLNLKLFDANISLNNNSIINVVLKNENFVPSANLSGNISFLNSKFNSNGGSLAFQNLIVLTSAPYITNGIFTLHNISGGQTKVNNFPVSINDIMFGINQGSPVLGFSITLNFSDQSSSSIGVGTSLEIKGKTELAQQTFNGENPITFTRPKFKFDRIIINGISVNYKTGPIVLKGTVLYKDNDPVYGNGFFGTIEIGIPLVSPTPINVSCGFGSMPTYKYFYLDAKVTTNISLGQIPLVITRFIGGVYYHMSPNKITEDDYINLNKNFNGVAGNALVYVPNSNTSLGLKTGVSYKCTLSEFPYNGDVIFEVNFTNSGGLGTVSLSGDIYALALINNKDKAPVKGKVQMVFDIPSKTFDAVSQVVINSFQIVTGLGYYKLHMDPTTWYACLGKPSKPNNIQFSNLVNVPFYCMIGNSIEAPLPPPADIAEIPNVSSFYGNRNNSQLQTAGGFCAGGKISSSLSRKFGFSFFNVEGAFNFDLGFDMMMTNYGTNSHCLGGADKVGLNGWLAEGSMYLLMNGKVSVNGSYKFTNDCPKSYQTHLLCGPGHCCCIGVTIPCIFNGGFNYNVFEAGVKAVVAAKGPTPCYFAGAINCNYNIMGYISGNFNYDFNYGNNCIPVSN